MIKKLVAVFAMFVFRTAAKDAFITANRCTYISPCWQLQIVRYIGVRRPTPADPMYSPKKTKKDGKFVVKTKRTDPLAAYKLDWSNFYEAANSYNAYIMPMEVRMGRETPKKVVKTPMLDWGNVELLKIPNFLHLTPPAIKKHCEALKEYCSPWPAYGNHPKCRPISVTTTNYIYSGPSIRHPDSRRVRLTVQLRNLNLSDHAYQKIVLLAGDRYNPNTDKLTLKTDKCPSRQQNKDYAYYLLTALYHESRKKESWEAEVSEEPKEKIDRAVEMVRAEMNPIDHKMKRMRQTHSRIVNGKLVRYNRVGHPFTVEMRKYGIRGTLTNKELKLAKMEWEKIVKDLYYERCDDEHPLAKLAAREKEGEL